MEYVKIPIDEILFSDLNNKQTLNKIKAICLIAHLEKIPTENQKKQFKLDNISQENYQNYYELIKKEIESVVKKRTREKIRYQAIVDVQGFSASRMSTECQQNNGSLPPQIRLDEIKLDKIRLDEEYTQIQDLWNEVAEELNLTKIIKLTPKRLSAIKQRIKETEFNFSKIIEEIKQSEFLLGKNTNLWKVDFDFIFLSTTNYLKILEGKYRNKKNILGDEWDWTKANKEVFDCEFTTSN